jgi:hypothetical protein
VRHIASGVVSKPISSYMTKSPITIGRSASLAKAHALMREHDIRHLPVMQSGHVVGVVSLGGLHLLETIANFPLEAVDVDEAMTASPEIVFASVRVAPDGLVRGCACGFDRIAQFAEIREVRCGRTIVRSARAEQSAGE